MSLTNKDLVTTILAATTAGLYYAQTQGIKLPLITGYRGGILALAIIGIAMCASSGSETPSIGSSNPFIVFASILGFVSLVLIVYGLVTGTKIAFTLLTICILVLWLTSTLRHLLT